MLSGKSQERSDQLPELGRVYSKWEQSEKGSVYTCAQKDLYKIDNTHRNLLQLKTKKKKIQTDQTNHDNLYSFTG